MLQQYSSLTMSMSTGLAATVRLYSTSTRPCTAQDPGLGGRGAARTAAGDGELAPVAAWQQQRRIAGRHRGHHRAVRHARTLFCRRVAIFSDTRVPASNSGNIGVCVCKRLICAGFRVKACEIREDTKNMLVKMGAVS
jgi:hypothetical protein